MKNVILFNDICKCLEVLIFSDKDDKLWELPVLHLFNCYYQHGALKNPIIHFLQRVRHKVLDIVDLSLPVVLSRLGWNAWSYWNDKLLYYTNLRIINNICNHYELK